MTAIDFNAHRHPVLAVACPDCRARVGAWCRRPSGHKATDLHRRRKAAADKAWEKAGCPTIGDRAMIAAETKPEAETMAPIEPRTFAELLAELQLRQVDVVRLLQLLGDGGDISTVNRWALGKQPAPPAAIAMLRLYAMLPERRRAQLLRQAREAAKE